MLIYEDEPLPPETGHDQPIEEQAMPDDREEIMQVDESDDSSEANGDLNEYRIVHDESEDGDSGHEDEDGDSHYSENPASPSQPQIRARRLNNWQIIVIMLMQCLSCITWNDLANLSFRILDKEMFVADFNRIGNRNMKYGNITRGMRLVDFKIKINFYLIHF